MAERVLVMFDDDVAQDWQPFTLTRPAGELRFGAFLLRERAERVLGARCVGHIGPRRLKHFDEPGAPPVISPDEMPRDADLILLSSRAVLGWGADVRIASEPRLLTIDDALCGATVPAGTDPIRFAAALARRASKRPPDAPQDERRGPADWPPADAAAALEGVERNPVPGCLLTHVWELMSEGVEQVTRDVEALHPNATTPDLPAGVESIGEHRLVLGKNVRIEPHVVLDLTDGPIWLEDDVHVRAFTRLAGPVHLGRGSTIFGGTICGLAAGPVCKLRGEIEATVIVGYSNKAHDGFLGHAYLGMWVNLGAMTTNSDLKNNYGEIDLWTPAGTVKTGEMKIGCFLGDHMKTGIGTIINTGTVVGAGSNLFGGEMPPKYVPPFRWGVGDSLSEYDQVKFLETAEVVMGRRDVELSPKQRKLLETAWRIGREEASEAELE